MGEFEPGGVGRFEGILRVETGRVEVCTFESFFALGNKR